MDPKTRKSSKKAMKVEGEKKKKPATPQASDDEDEKAQESQDTPPSTPSSPASTPAVRRQSTRTVALQRYCLLSLWSLHLYKQECCARERASRNRKEKINQIKKEVICCNKAHYSGAYAIPLHKINSKLIGRIVRGGKDY